METVEWSKELVVRTGAAIRRERSRLGITAQVLADACTERGVKMDRAAISKIETGRRSTLELAEVLVLARSLGVAPVDLVFPLDGGDSACIGSSEQLPMWDAVQWFGAEEQEHAQPPADDSLRALHEEFRRHRTAVFTAARSQSESAQRRRQAAEALDPDQRERMAEAATHMERLAHLDYVHLREIRGRLRAAGVTPPSLPPALVFIDSSAPQD
ncbi:helix-turn-helix domain-containing protein [Streptacidiphilus fuscans]|uniref:Helix-turn-helix domain-containing protein n=1 Tax=Streptacidiphilus fuscans TaxID=2789292 RepID=A0A931B918_9ACTN|nr:helix-turn-helix domain-containing protein [Streptacidiphilus fuscans]MBF9071737.1 helix-turn-helix domain-containing protein [Streptacidiphilus fuscans]